MFGLNFGRMGAVKAALGVGPAPLPIANGIIHDVDNDSDGGDIINTLMAINGGHRH